MVWPKSRRSPAAQLAQLVYLYIGGLEGGLKGEAVVSSKSRSGGRGSRRAGRCRWLAAQQEIRPPETQLAYIPRQTTNTIPVMPKDPPKRSHPTHGVRESTDGPTVVFLTVCTRHRVAWLADELVEKQLIHAWQQAQAWQVGRYVLMPDHIHLFAAFKDTAFDLDRWVRYWKSLFSKLHNHPDHRWQTDHWDTRMRSVSQFQEKWDYVKENPVRAGLVVESKLWPYQGTVFDWVW